MGENMRFVRQTQTIRVTNFDMMEKKYTNGNMLPISIRDIICSPSNCDKTNVLINLLESTWRTLRERVHTFASKSLQQPKYRYLKNLLAPIEVLRQ